MFNLFGKKGDSLEERIVRCQQKRDWAGLVKAYYQLGVAAMEEGNLNRAQLWLCRADTIYGSDDAIYNKAGEKLIEDCTDRIAELEEESILYHTAPAKVSEALENLADNQIRVWGLLSLARLVKLGERLSALPGCDIMGKLGWAVDAVMQSLQAPPTEEVFNGLKNLCGVLYELGDDPDFWGRGSEIPVPGRAPFQVFDLNGLMGAHLEIDAYLDGQFRMICALSQGEEPPAPENGIIVQPLLPDYYVRTEEGRLEENPRIKAELKRIWSDYEFVSSGMTWEQIARRVAEYKNLDILA